MSTFEIWSLIITGFGVLLTGAYVLLTLHIANKTAESVKATQASLELAQEQLELNKQQSQVALEASEKHSQATIDAVNKQIAMSEQQSNSALAVAREQVEQSKQPILIPLSPLPLVAVTGEMDFAHAELTLEFMNVGTGVALNIWGVLVPPKGISRSPYAFSNEAHLLESKISKFVFNTNVFHSFSENDKIGEYYVWPSSELAQVASIKVPKFAARLTLTYIDVFGNKHATIYDYTYVNDRKFVAHMQVQCDLEDVYKEWKTVP